MEITAFTHHRIAPLWAEDKIIWQMGEFHLAQLPANFYAPPPPPLQVVLVKPQINVNTEWLLFRMETS